MTGTLPSTAEQAEFLKLVLDSTVEGFYSVDCTGQTTLCNAAFLKMLGFASADEVIGRRLHGDIHHSHPDGSPYEVNDCPIYKAASQGIAAHVPHELFYRKDGSSFAVEYRAVPIVRQGKLEGALCTFSDITARLRQDTELRETQEFTASIVESSPDCVKVLDREGRLLSMNDEGCRQMEVEDFSQQCLHSSWLGFWQGADGEKARHAFAEALNGRMGSFEGYCPTMKGQSRWWEVIVSPIRSADGSIHRLLSVSRDITSRHAVQDHLREAKEHLSLMLESAQDYAIISMDAQGRIIIWNTGAERIFGYRPEQAIGQNIALIFTPEDREAGAPEYELSKAAERGRSDDERWHLRLNGERFYASGIMAAMRNGAGQVKGFVKIARDMTAQQRAQEILMEARNAAEAANIAKTEFLANMSHEIRTPMNAIIGLTNILSMSTPLSDKQRDFLQTLQTSADSLLVLINDLLDIAKIEARTVELEHIPFSITQIIQEIASMMAVQVKGKGIEFTADGECVRQRMFLGDPTRLRQIITNLCSNAIKFTHRGGIHVSICCTPTDVAGIESVSIAVRDTGIGIAADKLETIFQKFVQADTSINRKYGGTGLGLTITKTLAEIMGGGIAVDSAIGQGSTFTVTIPLQEASNEQVVSADYSLESVVANTIEHKIRERVLLVEDYHANVVVATTYLEYFGYDVDVASNGLEGFEKAKHGQYVAILMDVQMHGMNGFEATKIIREHEAKNGLVAVPIIGMTAHALAGDRERCLAIGMDEYISKPFNPEELQAKLKHTIYGDVVSEA